MEQINDILGNLKGGNELIRAAGDNPPVSVSYHSRLVFSVLPHSFFDASDFAGTLIVCAGLPIRFFDAVA